MAIWGLLLQIEKSSNNKINLRRIQDSVLPAEGPKFTFFGRKISENFILGNNSYLLQ